MDFKNFITIQAGKRSGQPCIRGTRMTVTDVLEYLAAEMTPAEIVRDFPDLTLFERVWLMLPNVNDIPCL